MTFDAKTGKHKIYVLANVGSEDAAKEYTTEQALLSKLNLKNRWEQK